MTTQSSRPSLLETIARKRETSGYAALGIGVLLLALTIFFAVRWEGSRSQEAPSTDEMQPADEKKSDGRLTDRGDYLPAAIGSGIIAGLFLVAGAIQLSRKPTVGIELHETRLMIVAVGGVTGLLIALLGFAFGWRWQGSLLAWVNKGDLQEARWVLAALAIFLVGVAVMFVSMQPARAEERTSVVLRRMLYGTNAVLTGLLMLLMLTVVNVIVFMKLPDNVVTTAAGFKGLSPTSKEFLRTIKEPVKVYLIMTQNHVVDTGAEPYGSLYSDCRALLRACEEENKNFTSIHLSPATDDDEIKKVMKRVKVPEAKRDQLGMLITYGESEEFFEHILARELLTVIPNQSGRGGRIAFQGENRLMTELNFLSGGAQRPVVYFTQSNGEPSIGGGPADSSPRTARLVVQHLKERKYDIKPLVFQPGKKLDISDAEIVVVAAPSKPFSVEEAHVLREYLAPKKDGRRGGKLVAMLPAFPDINGNVSPTGLEALLSEFGILIEPNKRIFSFPQPDFEREAKVKVKQLVPGNFAPALRRVKHPVTDLLRPNDAILFAKLRHAQLTRTAVPPGMHGSELFTTMFNWPTYRDVRYDSDPDEVDALVRKEAAANNGVSKTFDEKDGEKNRPVSFGAYVAEVAGEGEQRFERPRVVVIGTDSFVDDESIRQSRVPAQNVNVIGQLFEWIRERPEGMKIEPQSLGTYNLPERPDMLGLLWLPTGLILMGIMALGIGVWVTRRT